MAAARATSRSCEYCSPASLDFSDGTGRRDVAALDNRGEGLRVRGRSDTVCGDGGGVRVGEVHMGSRLESREYSSASLKSSASTDVRDLQRAPCRLKPVTRPGRTPSRDFRTSSSPPNSHCIPRQMPKSGVPPRTADPIASCRGRRASPSKRVADAGDDDAEKRAQSSETKGSRSRRERPSTPCGPTSVARAVIDERNHSRPSCSQHPCQLRGPVRRRRAARGQTA